MNDDEIYDEFNYEPEDLEDDEEFKTETKDKTNYNQREKEIIISETPHIEEYADFDEINELDVNDNYEENVIEKISSSDKRINNNIDEVKALNDNYDYNNTNDYVNIEEKNYEINNGNIDNYLDELIKKNNLDEKNEDLRNKNNSIQVNLYEGKPDLKNSKVQPGPKSNEHDDKITRPYNQLSHKQLIEDQNNNNKFKSYNSKTINSTNVLSRMQIAENEYKDLKEKLEKLTEQPSSSDNNQQSIEFLAKENIKLIKYLEKISEILDVVVESSKFPTKPKNKSTSNSKYVKISNSKTKYANNTYNSNRNIINNNKLVEVYKKEYDKLQKRFKQISDPAYSDKLEQTLLELNSQLNYYEQENRNLQNRQKQSEFMFERQYKNNTNNVTNFEEETKKINQEYENMKRLNEVTYDKAQRNMISIKESEEKIQSLSEHNKKLQVIAKEMYNIDDLENFLDEEKNEQKANERRQALKKKIEILEKVLVNNKRKFETEINRNDKAIMNLEKNKLELMKILKEKSTIAFKTAGYVKGINHKNELISNLDSRILENEIKTQEMLERFLNNKEWNENDREQNPTDINYHNDVTNHNNGKSITINNNASNLGESQLRNMQEERTNNNIDASNFNNISNINRSIEDTKKEILRELDKKSIEKNEKKQMSIDNTIQQVGNKVNLAPVEDNKYIGKNNKPNFKFNFSQQQGPKDQLTKNIPTPVINNDNINLNIDLNKNKPETEAKIQNDENKNESDETNDMKLSKKENQIKEETLQDEINDKPLLDIINTSQVEAVSKDPILITNSRRLNNLNTLKNNDKSKDISYMNKSNLDNNTEIQKEKYPDVPSFLKDFKAKEINIDNTNNSVISTINNKKNSDKIVNLSQNNDISSILNDIPRRRKDNLGTVKHERKSIFEEALHGGFHEEKIENVVKEPVFLNKDKPEDDYYKKRREEFDCLFKDEDHTNNNKVDYKSTPNNIIYAPNRLTDLSINSKNVEDSSKKEKNNKAYANILDELEEIDLL